MAGRTVSEHGELQSSDEVRLQDMPTELPQRISSSFPQWTMHSGG